MSKVPDDLSWVKEKARCIPERAIAELRTQVEKDVQVYLTEGLPNGGLEIVDLANAGFSVKRLLSNGLEKISVRFALSGQSISIEGSGFDSKLTATPILSDEGDFRFRTEQPNAEPKLLTPWQLRRTALESLLFGV